jgi:hypothetical protein
MVEQRPFKALVVGSSPTQPNWISSPRFCMEAAPEAAERSIELRTKKAGKVAAKKVKKDKTATKTLKNSNKQQQTWVRGSEVVQSSKLLSGLVASKIGGKEKRLLLIL